MRVVACAGEGIMCVTGQYVKEMALSNGLWEAGFHGGLYAEDSTMLEERRSIGVSEGIMCVMGQYVKE